MKTWQTSECHITWNISQKKNREEIKFIRFVVGKREKIEFEEKRDSTLFILFLKR